MKIISENEVFTALKYPAFITALKDAYAHPHTMPPRQVFKLNENIHSHDAFALLPSWNQSVIALKSFAYFPDNKPPKKTLYAKILLFDRNGGEPIALVDGTSCTLVRTAGISALASSYLSRDNASAMLLLGTGNLSSYLIKAHASIRALNKIMVWGRDKTKAEKIVRAMQAELPAITFKVANDIESACAEADIIVSATGSHDILVKGAWVKPGTHTDFLGNHHADKRECDTDLVLQSTVYVDTYANCFKEAGEILVPIAEGTFTKEQVKGELAELCSGKVPGRTSDNEITLFKSVGSALSDLVAAHQAYTFAKNDK